MTEASKTSPSDLSPGLYLCNYSPSIAIRLAYMATHVTQAIPELSWRPADSDTDRWAPFRSWGRDLEIARARVQPLGEFQTHPVTRRAVALEQVLDANELEGSRSFNGAYAPCKVCLVHYGGDGQWDLITHGGQYMGALHLPRADVMAIPEVWAVQPGGVDLGGDSGGMEIPAWCRPHVYVPPTKESPAKPDELLEDEGDWNDLDDVEIAEAETHDG